MDAGFAEEERWSAIARSAASPARPSEEGFAPDAARELARTALNLAWTSARTEPGSARILFAMSRHTVQIIAGLGIHQIQQVAEHQPVHPMWADQLAFWQCFLAAAADPTPKLPPVHVRAMQRRLADLVPATAASQRTASSRR